MLSQTNVHADAGKFQREDLFAVTRL